MKPDVFEIPGSLLVERSLRREGPSPVYVAWIPHTSRMFYEKKPLLKFCKWPASTPSGAALREWLQGFDDAAAANTTLDPEEVKKKGWGPESHTHDDEDQTKDTKMVT